jgi:hypothetical protein
MGFGRSPFRALCEGIWRFQNELADAGMTSSLVINLDPRDFRGVLASEEAMFNTERLPDGGIRIMDAIVRPRRLKTAGNIDETKA